MAVQLSIHPSLNLLHSQYSGTVTGEDLRSNMQSIRNHPDYKPSLKRLVDLSNVSGFDYNVSEAVSLSQEVGLHYRVNGGIRCAYLAPSTLAFGMARMFATFLSDYAALDVGVFRNTNDAREFLGIIGPIPSIEES